VVAIFGICYPNRTTPLRKCGSDNAWSVHACSDTGTGIATQPSPK
jgi:hypothetical protein